MYNKLEAVSDQSIYLLNPVKNRILKNGYFIKLLHSTENLNMNGIYMEININDPRIENSYNKHKCLFSVDKNTILIEKCKEIENMILKKYKCSKIKKNNIYNQLSNGVILLSYYYPIHKNTYLLKISGIWETELEYGLSFKFININRRL